MLDFRSLLFLPFCGVWRAVDSGWKNGWVQTMNDSRKELSFMKSYRVKGVRYRSVFFDV